VIFSTVFFDRSALLPTMEGNVTRRQIGIPDATRKTIEDLAQAARVARHTRSHSGPARCRIIVPTAIFEQPRQPMGRRDQCNSTNAAV
jgi:hypothetical protein